MAEKDPNDPSTTSLAHDFMMPKWSRIETLLGGTDAMREAGQTYLPQHEQESDSNYDERLNSTTLFNMLELTLDSLVGQPFSSEIQLDESAPDPIKDILKDVNLQGDNVTVFSREWFREAMAKSFAHVLIDMPVKREREDGRQRTREDDMREQRRPYWVLVSPENVLAIHAETENGQEKLTHVRIKEDFVERNGFTEQIVERIRVLEPGSFEVFEKRRVSKNSKKFKWVNVDGGTTGLDFVPFLTFYANRTSIQTGKPPLEDLAHLNIRHWQSTSDQINVLTVARFPMLAVSGASDTSGGVMAIGPRQLLGTKDPQGRFYYVEHTGKAISAGRQDLVDLEDMMASYGAEFLKRRPGNMAATNRALNSAEATSALQDAAIRFNDALNRAIKITAAWLGLDGEADEVATVNTEFGLGGIDDATVKSLLEARKMGDLSRQDFLAELKRHGVLADDFDPRAALMRSVMEAATLDPTLANQVREDMTAERREQADEGGEDDAA